MHQNLLIKVYQENIFTLGIIKLSIEKLISESKEYFTFMVEDTGLGMKKEE